jgi:hypothetical protein
VVAIRHWISAWRGVLVGRALATRVLVVSGAAVLMDLPDCPRCDSANTLEKIRADTRGCIWALCTCCSHTMLIDANGIIVHVSTKEVAGGR